MEACIFGPYERATGIDDFTLGHGNHAPCGIEGTPTFGSRNYDRGAESGLLQNMVNEAALEAGEKSLELRAQINLPFRDLWVVYRGRHGVPQMAVTSRAPSSR